MTELVAEDAEGPRRVAEAASDLVGGESLDEVGAEGLVLSLERRFGGQEEPRLGVIREAICRTESQRRRVLTAGFEAEKNGGASKIAPAAERSKSSKRLTGKPRKPFEIRGF
jgi:hypothetical protein